MRLHGISLSDAVTAVEISASTIAEDTIVEGIGAYVGTRLGPNTLTLRDQALRAYRERMHDPRLDDTMPHGRHFALFDPMPDDAHEFALEVPYVFVQECDEQVTFEVPVTMPLSIVFGRYRARILRTYVAPAILGGADRPSREGGLGVDIDLGGWQDGRRLLTPRLVFVDGANRGLRYTNRFDGRAPDPVQQFEISLGSEHDAARVTLRGALVQVYGPWVLRFAR